MLTKDELITVNKDVSETIQYCRHKLGNGQPGDDIYEQIHRTNQNLQVIISEIINRMDKK